MPQSKYLTIKVEKKELKFVPDGLDENSKMTGKAVKGNWKQLQQMIRNEFDWNGKSRFVLVKSDNNNDQIESEGDLSDLWNELIATTKESYTLELRCLMIEKENDKTITWYPEGADDPNFRTELEKQDWDSHFEDLKNLIKFKDGNCLKDKQDNLLKTSKDLKKIWSATYKDDEPCLLQLTMMIKKNESDNSKKTSKKKKSNSDKDTDDEKEKDKKKKRTKNESESESDSESSNKKKKNKKAKKKNESESDSESSKKKDKKKKKHRKKKDDSESDSESSKKEDKKKKKKHRKKKDDSESDSESRKKKDKKKKHRKRDDSESDSESNKKKDKKKNHRKKKDDSDSNETSENERELKHNKKKKVKENKSEDEKSEEWDKLLPIEVNIKSYNDMDFKVEMENNIGNIYTETVSKIYQSGQQRIYSVLLPLRVFNRVEAFGDSFKGKHTIMEVSSCARAIQESVLHMFNTYGLMGVNYEAAKAISKWQPAQKLTPECESLWKGIISNCTEIGKQLLTAIRMGATFHEKLSLMHMGVLDFVKRMKLGETPLSAMQGLKQKVEEFHKFQCDFSEFTKQAEVKANESMCQMFNEMVGLEEGKEAHKAIGQLSKNMRAAQEKEKKLKDKHREIDEKIWEIMKNIGKDQGERDTCEILVEIAENNIKNQDEAIQWAERRKRSYEEKASSATNWRPSTQSRQWFKRSSSTYITSYQGLTWTGEQFKWEDQQRKMENAQAEYKRKKEEAIDKLAQNKERIKELDESIKIHEAKREKLIEEVKKDIAEMENSLEDINKKIGHQRKILDNIFEKTGIEGTCDNFNDFIQCYSRFQDSLVGNMDCVVSIEKEINLVTGWFEMKCSTTIDFASFLEICDLPKKLAPVLQNIGITEPIYLCFNDKKEFQEEVANQLKDTAGRHEIRALELICLQLNPKEIQKHKKKRLDASTAMMIEAARPLCTFLEALGDGMRTTTNLLGMKNTQKMIEL